MSKTKLITKRKCPAGETYVFSCGADSWSANDNQVVAREFIKPAKEE